MNISEKLEIRTRHIEFYKLIHSYNTFEYEEEKDIK